MVKQRTKNLQVGDQVVLGEIVFCLHRACEEGTISKDQIESFRTTLNIAGIKKGDRGKVVKVYEKGFVEVEFRLEGRVYQMKLPIQLFRLAF